ncbi:hypothetical protein [Ureibacillus sp. FSL K6-0165]|uniref:hypothetical protein n=1 Tax=Ureibacillus sp. FSL K6-0165 TaxID=2954606 RepID=UPI0030F931DD
MEKLKLLQLQFALFFEKVEDRPDRLGHKLESFLGNIFDKMPTVLPIPPNAPPDIPNVIMESSNGVYVCNISKTRIDFIVNCLSINKDSDDILLDFIMKVREFTKVVTSSNKVIRFGLVGKYFKKEANAVKIVQSNYFIKNLGDLEELSIRYNKRTDWKERTLNDIIEINVGVFDINGSQEKGIILMRDINNVPDGSELDYFNVNQLLEFISPRFKELGITELIK